MIDGSPSTQSTHFQLHPVDDVGYHRGKVGYSLYNCPADVAAVVRQTFAAYDGLVAGEPWYQGDHGLFLLNAIPALALTSDQLAELMGGITHTPNDTPAVVDVGRLAEVARALQDLLLHLDQLVTDGKVC